MNDDGNEEIFIMIIVSNIFDEIAVLHILY